ncbi:hypothetical protein ABT124_21050 [Streptomyces sp. NPDC001982]|uniref:hypothetical protein n=1 Tax=Streptomyces sp. NPDC001982 TaxID=3154405 RepID=UPI00332115E4
MTVDQLPARVREFANYLDGLLARLDQGGGWCEVFWQRDPEGMQACLDGREVPPWDVVEALLQDLAAAYGPGAAGAEKERARLLHGAALSAYDSRPGARDALGDRLDVMLREQRYAAERQAELGRFLASAGTPQEAHAIRLDLAWARDDHERATARCVELRSRITELDRRGAGGQVRDAQPIRRPGEGGGGAVRGGEPFPGARTDGGSPVTGSGGVLAQRSPATGGSSPGVRASGAYGGGPAGGVLADGVGTGGRGDPRAGAFGAEGGYRPAPGGPEGFAPAGYASAPGAADGTRGTGGTRATGAPETVPTRYASQPSAPAATSARHVPRPSAPHPSESAPAPAAYDAPAAPPRDSAPRPTATAQAQPSASPAPPAKQRKRRRGSARFAGMVEDDVAPVVVPQTPVPAVTSAADPRRTPRGARFAGAAEAVERPQPQVEPLDAEARRAVVEAVETLVRLRGEGRSGEAHGMLVEAAHWPAARLPLLAAELHRTGHGADWATLLWEAASLPAERLVAAADALVAAGRAADGQQILRQGVARPAGEIGEAVLALGTEGRRREVRALLDAYVRVRTPEEAARSVAADPQHLVPLLLEAAQGVSDERHWDLVHALRVAGFTA